MEQKLAMTVLMGLQGAPSTPPKEPPDLHAVRLGLVCYAVSTLFFALMSVTVKLAGRSGVPSMQIVFCRSIILLAFTIPASFQEDVNLLGNRRGLLCLRGLFGFGSITALFFGLQLLPLADMTVFTFLAPIMVAVGSPYFLRESLVEGTWATCAACMLAVVLVAQPSVLFGTRRLKLVGVLVGLLHPLCSACAKGTIRMLCPTESTNVIVFYLSIFSIGGSFLGMYLVPGQRAALTSWYQVLLLILTGLFGYGSQICMNMGLRRVKAAQAMSMAYLGIVWSGLAGILIFHELPNFFAAVGMGVITVATLSFGLRSTIE